jgi:hypothetical protein
MMVRMKRYHLHRELKKLEIGMMRPDIQCTICQKRIHRGSGEVDITEWIDHRHSGPVISEFQDEVMAKIIVIEEALTHWCKKRPDVELIDSEILKMVGPPESEELEFGSFNKVFDSLTHRPDELEFDSF